MDRFKVMYLLKWFLQAMSNATLNTLDKVQEMCNGTRKKCFLRRSSGILADRAKCVAQCIEKSALRRGALWQDISQESFTTLCVSVR